MVFQTQNHNRWIVAYWLMFMVAIVFAMIVVGGATRLTESGLSMVDWRPVTGILPPITANDWQVEFSKYQTSPEYKIKNFDMTISEFKGIFYWEWGHRLLGRLIGVFFLAPMIWFWARGQIPVGYKKRLFVLLILGGGQGFLGWYMVMSGLVNEPAVSHYRLTAHLSLALFILGALFWTVLDLLNPKPVRIKNKYFKMLAHVLMFALVLQLVMGGLVAGLKAGHIFNTWPLMGEHFVPSGVFDMVPIWRNFFDNAIAVQFDHRIGAYLLLLLTLGLLGLGWRENRQIWYASILVALTMALQIVLGIVMLLHYVPVNWGVAHQAGGVLVLMAVVSLMHLLRKAEAL